MALNFNSGQTLWDRGPQPSPENSIPSNVVLRISMVTATQISILESNALPAAVVARFEK